MKQLANYRHNYIDSPRNVNSMLPYANEKAKESVLIEKEEGKQEFCEEKEEQMQEYENNIDLEFDLIRFS